MSRTKTYNTRYVARAIPRRTIRTTHDLPRTGSALILAVVLVSLLAVVGVVFLVASRVDWLATSSVSENRQLNYAVDTVVAQICAQLAIDVPGAPRGDEYYDYPDPCNAWLACLEPYYSSSGYPYRWRQVSNIYNDPAWAFFRDVPAIVLPDYNNLQGFGAGTVADADGDGVSDSMWVEVPGITSSKGKPIYAAIRIIDNGGMLNINTGCEFDPNAAPDRVDGSSQLQINVAALAGRPFYAPVEVQRLLQQRTGYPFSGLDPNNLGAYAAGVVWQYDRPAGPYTPFDISDELAMRNRFLLRHRDFCARLENWGAQFRGSTIWTPVPSGGIELDNWFLRACGYGLLDPLYAYRHIATTHNIDRIIDPNSERLFNINNPALAAVTRAIQRSGLDPNFFVPAQITANLVDYIDSDSEVTVITDPCTMVSYYGFETPCVYISELVHNYYNPDPNDPNKVFKSFAIELHKPDFYDPMPEPNGEWELLISSSPNSIPVTWTGTNRFHIIWWEDPCALFPAPTWSDINAPNDVNMVIPTGPQVNAGVVLSGGDVIQLRRRAPNGVYITVDKVIVPVTDFNSSGWLEPNVSGGFALNSIEREIHPHRCIRRIWSPFVNKNVSTLGSPNLFTGEGMGTPYYMYKMQAHPGNGRFVNVGQIQMAFYRDATTIGPGDTESTVRFDFTAPLFQPFLNNITVFDPNDFYGRIKGRVNINTAPWYVLAQLPWVSYHTPGWDLARAIVDYRDNIAGPFKSTAELMNVGIVNADPNNLRRMDYYALDGGDLAAFPDLTGGDDAADDFEERDVIFARISNLVTVRSDVFTAYILVRIGRDGPQKRVIAVLDRSKVYPGDSARKVEVIAVQPVADPR